MQHTPSDIITSLLPHLDNDHTREGLQDTPKRYENS